MTSRAPMECRVGAIGASVAASVALAGVVAVLAFSGCSRGDDERLVLYSAGPRPLAEFACRTFTEQTGIPVELFTATTGQIMAKLEAEKYRPRADVVLFANQTAAVAMKDAGRLMPTAAGGFPGTRGGWSDPEGHFHATAASCVGIATAAGAPLPTVGWRDLLVGEFAERLVMPSPSRSGTAGDFTLAYYQMHPETFWDDFLAARRSGMQIVGANSQAITGLMIGAYRAVFAAADYIICREIEKGEPLAVQFPEPGAPYVFRPIAVMSATRNPEAAERFVEHYFSREVQEEVAATHLIPALEGVPLSGIRAGFPVPAPLPFDPQQALADQKALIQRFQFEIERATIR